MPAVESPSETAESPRPDAARPAPPRHVAIIMDGNGRWAKAHHLPRAMGHRRGVEAMRAVTRAAKELGVEYLTLYSFSSENWSRPADEVNDLMGLLRHFVKNDIAELKANDVRVTIIGEREGLPRDIADLIDEAEAETCHNGALKLQIAFNYGGQDEIVTAARLLAHEVAAGRLKPEAITKELFARYLHTAGIPDPDLVIRTSGEQRISNFLIWQCAYAEFVFVPALWPDFAKSDLDRAIAEYRRRERRFGARLVQATS
jgi:undecaprenyl diphosphate synthase